MPYFETNSQEGLTCGMRVICPEMFIVNMNVAAPPHPNPTPPPWYACGKRTLFFPRPVTLALAKTHKFSKKIKTNQ